VEPDKGRILINDSHVYGTAILNRLSVHIALIKLTIAKQETKV